MNTLFGAQFTKNKVGVQPSVAPLLDLWQIHRTTGVKTQVATGAATVYAGRGIYYYLLATYDPYTYTYTGAFYTTDTTVDAQEPPVWQQDWSDALAKDANGKMLLQATQTGVTIPTVTTVGSVTGAVASVTADVGITQAGADKVWGSTTRTLSSFGTLIADITTAIWGATTRTLSAFGFTVNTNANATETGIAADYARRTGDYATAGAAMALTTGERTSTAAAVRTNLATELARIDENVSAAKTLTGGERTSIANEVESHLLNEGDSQMLINAIVGAIGNTNIDQTVLVAALRSDLERAGGNLNTLLTRNSEARLSKLDVTGALANTSNAASFKADVTNLSTTAQVNANRDTITTQLTSVQATLSNAISGIAAAPTPEAVASAVAALDEMQRLLSPFTHEQKDAGNFLEFRKDGVLKFKQPVSKDTAGRVTVGAAEEVA